MAIRNVLPSTNEILRKKCKPVVNFDDNLHILLDDMKETMRVNNGCGLAGPQVGILKRVAVVEVDDNYLELVNPKIVYKKGVITDLEGCLSVKDVWGYVERPKKVIVEAFDRNGNPIKVTATDFFARAICHEVDHLDGIVFTDIMTELYVPQKNKKEKK